MDDFDRRWERIQQELARQMNGDERPRYASTRTLFGIRSTAEVKMDEFVAEIEAEQAAKRKAREEAEAAAAEEAGAAGDSASDAALGDGAAGDADADAGDGGEADTPTDASRD